MTNFTELNSKEMTKTNGGVSVVLGPVIGPVIAYAIIKRFMK